MPIGNCRHFEAQATCGLASEAKIICSEAPQYDPDWTSDITLSLNGLEIGTWTSPGDFGGVRARMTPDWWQLDQSMHGLLKRFRVAEDGAFVNGEKLSEVRLADLKLEGSNHVAVRLEVKADARHVGGLNLFGRKFGNDPQDLVMRLEYAFEKGSKPVQIR